MLVSRSVRNMSNSQRKELANRILKGVYFIMLARPEIKSDLTPINYINSFILLYSDNGKLLK